MMSSSISFSDFDDSDEGEASPFPQRGPAEPGPSAEKRPGEPGPSTERGPGEPGPSTEKEPSSRFPPVREPTPLPAEEMNFVFSPDPKQYTDLKDTEKAGRGVRDHRDQLLLFLKSNYLKVQQYDFFAENVAKLVNEYGRPGMNMSKNVNPGTIVSELKFILDQSKRKFEMFDIPIQHLGLLKGAKVQAIIAKSTNKISEVLDAAHRRASDAEDRYQAQVLETLNRDEEITMLRGQLDVANKKIKELQGERFYEEPPAEKEFLDELQLNLDAQENANSSLIKELRLEREVNEGQLRYIRELEEQNIRQHEERMNELTDALKDIDLHEGFQRAIVRKIKTLSADEKAIAIAVTDWTSAIKGATKSKQQEYNELSQKVKDLHDAIASEETKVEELRTKFQVLNASIPDTAKDIQAKILEYQSLAMEGKALQVGTKNLEKGLNELQRGAAFSRSKVDGELAYPERRKRLHLMKKTPFRGPIYEDSPPHLPAQQREPGPSSHHSSPSRRMPTTSDRATSPFRDMQHFHGAVAAETQTSNVDESYFLPEVEPQDSSTQRTRGVRNRFDVGESFNMQTVQDTGASPSPYSQVTRVDRSLPQSGSSRMSDSSFSVRHRAELGTPDKHSRTFNVTPSPNKVSRQVVLTSPRRQEPLLVNIDVDPQPLIQTESGEHFVCDISLSVQPEGTFSGGTFNRAFIRQERPSPQAVYTYHQPPAVTPTTTRRHGLFTPAGIFKKKHFNVRRVHWPDEYYSPELPWSPHGFPDAHTPITSLDSSRDISDRTISWERSPDTQMNRTFEVSPDSRHSQMNRTYEVSPDSPQYGKRSHVHDRTFHPRESPIIKGPYYRSVFKRQDDPSSGPSYRSRFTEQDDGFPSSPSPVIQGPSHRSRFTGQDDGFSSSPSPVIQGPSYRSRFTGQDDGFSSSPSPASQGSSYRSRFTGQDNTFSSSPSPAIKGPSHRSRLTRQDDAFDISPSFSPDRSFPSHGSNTFESSPRGYRSTQSYGTPSSSRSDGISRYQTSYSPESEGSYSRGPSSQLNKSFYPSSPTTSPGSQSGISDEDSRDYLDMSF